MFSVASLESFQGELSFLIGSGKSEKRKGLRRPEQGFRKLWAPTKLTKIA